MAGLVPAIHAIWSRHCSLAVKSSAARAFSKACDANLSLADRFGVGGGGRVSPASANGGEASSLRRGLSDLAPGQWLLGNGGRRAGTMVCNNSAHSALQKAIVAKTPAHAVGKLSNHEPSWRAKRSDEAIQPWGYRSRFVWIASSLRSLAMTARLCTASATPSPCSPSSQPLRGRFARLDRSARRWPLAIMFFC